MFIIFKRYEVFIVGVTIALLTGDNGIINKSGDAKYITEISNEKEELEVAVIRFSDKRGNLDPTKMVNGLQKEIKNLKEVSNTDGKFPVKVEYKNGHKYQVSKDGDIILYTKNKSGTSKHVLMRGDGVIYEAQYESTYGHVNTAVKKKLDVKRPKVVIFRAK